MPSFKAERFSLHLTKYVKRYSTELNPLSHDHQGKVFSRFREKEKFVRLVADFGVHSGTIIFRINLFRLLDEYPKLKKSSVTLSFMKNYFKNIKQICKVSSEFK